MNPDRRFCHPDSRPQDSILQLPAACEKGGDDLEEWERTLFSGLY